MLHNPISHNSKNNDSKNNESTIHPSKKSVSTSNTLKYDIRIIKESEKKIWDDYADKHAQASPYHYFSWQHAIQQAYGHESIYLIATHTSTNEKQSKLCGILPIIKMSTPLLGKKLCALPFCDVGHCLADNYEIELALVKYAKRIVVSEGYKSFEYRHSNKESLQADEIEKLIANKIAPKVRMLMPLPENADILWDGFKSKLRSQVRKAEKNNLSYSIAADSKHLNDFYTVFSHNMRDLGSPVHSFKLFETLLEEYQDKLLISVVYLDKQPIAAGMILTTPEVTTIPWASTIAQYNKLSPNMLLYWSLLKFSADSNSKTFDFGRSTLNEGTYRFKRQWGASPYMLEWETFTRESIENDPLETPKNSSHELQESASSSKKWVQQLIISTWKKLPLSISNILGPAIRKYISL